MCELASNCSRGCCNNQSQADESRSPYAVPQAWPHDICRQVSEVNLRMSRSLSRNQCRTAVSPFPQLASSLWDRIAPQNGPMHFTPPKAFCPPELINKRVKKKTRVFNNTLHIGELSNRASAYIISFQDRCARELFQLILKNGVNGPSPEESGVSLTTPCRVRGKKGIHKGITCLAPTFEAASSAARHTSPGDTPHFAAAALCCAAYAVVSAVANLSDQLSSSLFSSSSSASCRPRACCCNHALSLMPPSWMEMKCAASQISLHFVLQ